MQVIEALTQKNRWTMHHTMLRLMNCHPTHKASTCTKEKVSIHIRQLLKHIKGVAINSNRDTRREG
jgi:hypothetical protein